MELTLDATSMVEMLGGSTAPWWGAPAIAGASLLIGAVLGYLFTRANEHRKADREDEQRRNAHLLELSIKLVNRSQKMTTDARQLAGAVERADSARQATIRTRMIDTFVDIYETDIALYVVAPTHVSSWAHGLTRAANGTLRANEPAKIRVAANLQNRALTDYVKQLRFYLGYDAKLAERDPLPEAAEPSAAGESDDGGQESCRQSSVRCGIDSHWQDKSQMPMPGTSGGSTMSASDGV